MEETAGQKAPTLNSILLVEDNPADALLTTKILEEEEVCNHVGVATDGVEALQYLRREGEHANARKPDIILLDLNMPRMDGHEFLEKVKADQVLRSIPVVVLTSSDADQDIHLSYDLQAAGFVKKPVSLQPLAEMLRAFRDYWGGVVKLRSE